MRHLPTNGGGPALTALPGNNAQVPASSVAAANTHIKSGKIRALASYSDKRVASLPDVPTMKELGLGVEFYLWVGPVRTEGDPDAVGGNPFASLRRRRLRIRSYAASIANLGDTVRYMDQPDFAKFWDEDAKRVEAAVQSIGKVEG